MALTTPRDTPMYAPNTSSRSYPVKAATKIYAGALVALNAGLAVPASTAIGLVVIGRAEQTVDNSAGADSALNVITMSGTFSFTNSDSITMADVGGLAYAVSDSAVSKDGTGKSVAGIIEYVDANGVWVRTDIGIAGVMP